MVSAPSAGRRVNGGPDLDAPVGTPEPGIQGPSDEGRHEFPTLSELRQSVAQLEQDLRCERPSDPLSGRIIHASLFLPFRMQPMAEVEYVRRREEQAAASNTVAELARLARARRAVREAQQAEQRAQAEQRSLQQQQMAQGGGAGNAGAPRKSSFWGSRRPSGISGMRSQFLDSSDLEAKLWENQERSRRVAGRRAWMMTEVVDDTSEASEEDRFTPTSSRRGSAWRARSSVSSNVGPDLTWVPGFGGGVSDAPSPMSPAEEVAKPEPPRWFLQLLREHSALNSGIHSLAYTHRQTFIGQPQEVVFAVQSQGDQRTDCSQTTPAERAEIEEVLAALEDRATWTFHDNSLQLAPGAQDDNGSKFGIRHVPVWLDYQTARGHYDGYCKTTLWPLFHYLLWRDDATDRGVWDEYSWEAYVAANQAYADRVAAEYQPGDMVWVHDYHLLLVPHMLRKKVPEAHIGLFMHSSFPSSEFFRCLPQRREVLEGMLGADLACFQNRPYSRHFVSCCVRICGFEVLGNSIESFNGRVTNISYNPIGIDVARVSRDCTAPGVAPKMAQLRELYAGKRLVVGCDKLDVVRGVVQKLQAFAYLLANYPQWRERVVLVQITVPALNSSPKLERQVSELVNQINGDFGSLSFTPVQHYHQFIDPDEYYALLSVADLFLVTSVRDGMNSTSMEYVLCQGFHGHGPMVISEFTGTAGRLPAAIQINPWDNGGVSAAIDRALTMGSAERDRRHALCHTQVVSQTSQTWALALVQQMLERLRHRHSAHSTPTLDVRRLVERFSVTRKRGIFLDYDGTLTPIVNDPATAVPSQRLLDALRTLTEDERNAVYIISGRDEKFLTKHFSHLPALGLSAEHGSYFREHGSGHAWQSLSHELDMSWKPDVLEVFQYYTDLTIGSNIEEKKSSIVWHYRNSDPFFGPFQAKDCQAHLENIVTQNNLPVEVVVGKKNVEVRPLAVNKGAIMGRILYANPEVEFVYCVGDDKTDEDMFRMLAMLPCSAEDPRHEETCLPPPPGMDSALANAPPRRLRLRRSDIFTSTVGPSSKKTVATWHLGNVDDVVNSLAEMAAADQRTTAQA